MAIDIEKVIKDIVDKNYPSDPFIFRISDYSHSPGESHDDEQNFEEVGDGTGREYFMWGYSEWGGDDIVAE